MSPPSNAAESRERLADAAVWSALVLTTFLLYGAALGEWWTGDDTQNLLAGGDPPGRYLWSPEAWLRSVSFNPFLRGSIAVDLALFGLRSVFFYVHQLVALAVAAGLVFTLLRLPLGRAFAALGAFLFLVGPPVPVIAHHLYTRHYAEGLVFALFSTYAFLRSARDRSAGWAAATGIAAFAAFADREMFAPLPFLFLVVPVASRKERLRAAAPSLFALALYVAWRLVMMHGYVGAYEGRLDLLTLGKRLPRLFGLIGQSFFAGKSSGALAAAVLAAVLAAGILFAWRKLALLAIALAAAILVPLLAVMNVFSERYLFLPWLAVGLATAAGASAWALRFRKTLLPACGLMALLVGALVLNRSREKEERMLAKQSVSEGKFFFERSGPGDVLRAPAEAGWYFDGLAGLRKDVFGRGPAGRVVYDDIAFCPVTHERVFAWDPATESVRDITGDVPRLAKATCARVRDVPLSARVSYEGSTVRWSLGPWSAGRWTLLSGDSLSGTSAAAEGTMHLFLTGSVPFRIRYESPEGWLAYSPPLKLEVAGDRGMLDWKR